MAQHDYVIANQSGAAFRADLNNGLAAIVSQNSGSSQPSTTYAYQWWADTTTGLLKQRNAANNAWITIGTLADANLGLLSLGGGTMTGAVLADDASTAALPAIAFDGDPDTGIFRKGANQLGLSAGGTERACISTTEVVFNDAGGDVDFRIEGDTDPDLFKIDAGTDQVQVTNLNGGPLAGTRNRIINGDMVIQQYFPGLSPTFGAGSAYVVDRWVGSATIASNMQVGRSTDAPTGFTTSQRVAAVTGATLVASSFHIIAQRIEGFNVYDLNFGTANAKTVTISFWVKSSITGTHSGALRNSGSTRSYPFTYSISAANTWEKKSVTLPGDTIGTWLKDTGMGIELLFDLGSGSTYRGTAGAWAATNLVGVTGAAQVIATAGATWFITGVQFEAGSVATPFEFLEASLSALRVFRYYINAPAGSFVFMASTFNSAQFPVVMRGLPTVTLTAGTLASATQFGFHASHSATISAGYTADAEL